MSKICRIAIYKPKLANNYKQKLLVNPIALYQTELKKLIDMYLYQDNVPKFAKKEITDNINLPSRLSQVCAKQASAIVRSIHEKVKLANKSHNKQKYQKEILDKFNDKQIKIDVKSVNIELDSRFIDIQQNKSSKLCDYWIKITSFPKGSFYIPLKLTKNMTKLISSGFVMQTNHIRIHSDGRIGIFFEKDKPIKNVGFVAGCDIGRNKIIAVSNGNTETTHKTGRLTKDIIEKLNNRKQTSKAHVKTRKELINQINYSVKNDIPWDLLQQLVIEDLKEIKQGNKWGKRNQFWRVGHAHKQIELIGEANGVRITRVSAAYTSQSCSLCGFIHRNNRNNEKFRCMNCKYETDADINAAVNIRNRGANSPSVLKI